MIWPFNNNSSWADKVEVHYNERKTSTYFTQARIAQELEAPGGRFAEVERPMMVGAEPVPAYPGSGGPWNDPFIRMMHEPPTGFAVDAQEPTGTAQEIERSLSALAETSPVGSATRAEPADPAVPVVDRGSAIHAEVETKLKALLGRGIVRRRKL